MAENYTPNSHKYKAEQAAIAEKGEKKIEKVVSGNVKTHKKGSVRKLTDIFMAEDVQNVKDHIIHDIAIPMIKDAIYGVVQDSFSMMLFGETTRKRGGSIGTRVSYRDYYDDRKRGGSRDEGYRRNRGFDVDDIVLETRADAEAVMDALFATAEEYGIATVGDLYDMVEKTAPYTANRYGWTKASLERSKAPSRERDGYVLNLPKPRAID